MKNSLPSALKKILLAFIFTQAFTLNGFSASVKEVPLFPLTIYRPSNTEDIDSIRCWLKIEDENGNDVTYTCAYASYAWIDTPNARHEYERTYFLQGGMAMHLSLKPGKYRITVYTPLEHLKGFSSQWTKNWESNTFEYSTENPCNVIFVRPQRNDNGFYSEGWYIDYRAPKFYRWTK